MTDAAAWSERWIEGAEIPAPLRLYATTVPEAWIDYHGHMSEAFYLMAFSDAIDPMFHYIGAGADYREKEGTSFFTVSWRLDFLDQVRLGDRIDVSTRVLDCDARRMHLWLELLRSGQAVATAEQLLVHVDLAAGRSVEMPDRIARCLQAIRASHDRLPRSGREGIGVGMRRRS